MRTVSSVELGEVATFVRGITFKPEDVVGLDQKGAVACMRTKNVQPELDLRDVWAVHGDFVRRDEQFLREGDILVSSANSWNLVGKCCWTPALPWPATLGGFISALRGDPSKAFPRFLYHWFSSPPIQTAVRNCGRQTTNISNLNFERCLALKIPLPSLPEQRRLASILDEAKALLDKRRQAHAKIAALTESFFRGHFGDLVEENGPWPVVPFESLVRETKLGLVRGSSEFGPDYEFPYIRMNAITREGQMDFSTVQRTHATKDELQEFSLQRGDFLFNTRNSRELVGKTTLFQLDDLFLFNNNLMRVRFKDHIIPEYVAEAFQRPLIQRELEARKSGTTSVFAIYWKELKTLPLPVPPVDLQRKFATQVAAVEQLKRKQEASRSTLDALFASLQHRAFRGEL